MRGAGQTKGSRGKLIFAVVVLIAASGITAWQVMRAGGSSRVEPEVADRAQAIQQTIQASAPQTEPVADKVAPPPGGIQKSPGRGPSQVPK